MSGCPKNYAGYNGTDDCNRSHSASLLYFISTIATMIVLGAATLLFFCCLYYKRRRIQERLRNARMRQAVPFTYYWPNNNNNNNSISAHEGGGPGAPVVTVQGGNQTTEMLPKATADRVAPLSCVIMAGEERPTFLAHPLPNDAYVDVNLDSNLADLEKGKQDGDPKP